MRSLEINKQDIYYASYTGVEPLYDEYENEIGTVVTYSTPISYRINVSAAKGEMSTRQFGDSEDYNKVMVTSDMNCPITEGSVLWVDRQDTDASHDYIVKRVARGLNTISIAIAKVDVYVEPEAIN